MDGLLRGEIGLHELHGGIAVLSYDGIRRSVPAFHGPTNQNDSRAFLGQSQRRGPPNTTISTGDHADLASHLSHGNSVAQIVCEGNSHVDLLGFV